MKQSLFVSVLCIGMPFPTQIFASDECKWKSWPQLADTLIKSAPELIPFEKKAELGRRRIDSAALGPHSRASAQYLSGTSPANSGEGEFSYEWTIESDAKKSARVNAARSDANLTAAEIEEKKALIILELAILSERIHQIDHENEVLEETLGSYRSLLKQYTSFPALSPEQEVSVSVFKLARDETQIKLGQLRIEMENYRSIIKQMTSCTQINLPSESRPERRVWPKIPTAESLKTSSVYKKIEARKKIAKETLESEIRQTEADFSVGPIARWTKNENDQDISFGVALSIPIVSQQRKILSSTAQASYHVSEAESELELKNVSSTLEKWTAQYKSSLSILNEGYAELDVRGKHTAIERASASGRVNAPLAIEAHRQMYEHMISRHQIEMKASEALWNIRFLTGTLSKDDL